MILADKIIEERKRNGWSQEELADRLSVSRQSVSKWESAQAVPDLNRIIQLADIFSVTTDYLLRDDAEKLSTVSESTDISSKARKVSMEEANDFMNKAEKTSALIALGVSLCIFAPAPLVSLSGMIEEGAPYRISETAAVGIGITLLLLLVAAAVFIFIKCSSDMGDYEFLEKTEIETAYGVSGVVKEKKKNLSGKLNTSIAVGTVLCILSAVPLIICSVMNTGEYIITAMVSVLLLIVAFAVNIILNVSIINGSYDKLLQQGSYTVQRKKRAPVIGRISLIYWMLAVAGYLAWSFSVNFSVSWLIWPVAGVSYVIVIAVAEIILKIED